MIVMTNKKIEKSAFILIIILLVIFVPTSSFAVYFHLNSDSKSSTNNNHELFYDNKLWFYDAAGTLLSTYTCETSNCGYASNTIDDASYAIDYYKQDNYDHVSLSSPYVFLTDFNDSASKSFLYNTKTSQSFKSNAYESIKDYGIGLANDLYIVKNMTGKVGVIKLLESVTPVVPFEYDFIGLINNTNEDGKLISDYFVAKKEDAWYIISSSGAVLSSPLDKEIVTFTGNLIVVQNESSLDELVDYEGNTILEGEYNKISFFDKYVLITTLNNEFYLYDLNTNSIVSNTYQIDDDTKINVNKTDTKNLEIYLNDELVETVIID